MEYLIQGVVLGLGLNLLLGPIFIIITQTSIDKGIKAALFVAIGIWISDILISYICFKFLSQITPLVSDPSFKIILGIIGAIILIVIGSRMAFTIKNKEESFEGNNTKQLFNFALEGFLINTINPFTMFFWVGAFTSVVIVQKAQEVDVLYFLFGILGVIIIFDLIKILLARKIRHFLQPERLRVINKYAGILFIIMGVFLFVRSIY